MTLESRPLQVADQTRLPEMAAHRARLDAIIRSIPGVVWEAWGEPDGKQQRIGYVSEYAEKLLGYSLAEWTETPNFWLTLVHPDDRARAAAESRAIFQTGEPGHLEFRWVAKDGRVRWIQAHTVAIRDETGRRVGTRGVALDITTQRNDQAVAREQRNLLAWQGRVLESVAMSAPLATTLETLCREAEAHTPGRYCSVLLVDPDGTRLRQGAAPSLPAHYNAAVDGIPIGEGVGSCGTAAFRLRRVSVTDIETDELWKDFRALALPLGLRACWSSPILDSDGKLLGTWAVYSSQIGLPDERDEALTTAATRLAAIAIERAHREEELRDQRDLTKTITDNAGSALFMLNENGYPIFMNAAASDLTGYAHVDEIKGQSLHDSLHFRKPDGTTYRREECPLHRPGATVRTLKDHREVFCRKDGTLFPVALNLAPVVKGGKHLGAVIEFRDVTRQERAERAARQRTEELARLATQLETSNKELDQFAYVTSHDLKAPLRGIANLSRWIEEDLGESVTPDAREHLELLRGRVHRMESLIDAILEYSRVGRKRARIERVDVGALLRETSDLLAPPAGLRIETIGAMPQLDAERAGLQQVFMNLISNAIKHHHDPAHAVIRITHRDAGSFEEFTVADNGPGIAKRYHDRVFVIFQTLEARDKVEGTGIGLALVKKIVEGNGGTIRLESDEGRGASFTFTWPKRPPHEMEKETDHA